MSSNGSNARLDRIEKLIQESERTNKEAHARHEREMADIRAEGRKTREEMRRWAALAVQEGRSQRRRSQKLDTDIGRLVSSQLETEAMLKGLISSLKATGNGGPKPA